MRSRKQTTNWSQSTRSMAVSTKLVASKCWQQMHGIFCIYKPTDLYLNHTINSLKTIISKDLGKMIHRKPRKIVMYDSTLGMPSETLETDYSDHPLVIGSRYEFSDVHCYCPSALSFYGSGVCVVGLNGGKKIARDLDESKPLRVYHLYGQLGVATDNLYKTGKVVERASYSRVSRPNVDQVAAMLEAYYQRFMYQSFKIPIQSQTAYDLALQGLIRPSDDITPIFYGIRCIQFKKPFFTLEVTCVNETEDLLLNIVHTVGIKLRSVARCNSIKCIRYGPFTLDHALLPHWWKVENIIENVKVCNSLNEEDIKSGRRETVSVGELSSKQTKLLTDVNDIPLSASENRSVDQSERHFRDKRDCESNYQISERSDYQVSS